MLKPKEFYDLISRLGVNFYAGIPNTILNPFVGYIQDHSKNHYICANEGNAVGMGIGHYLSTGEIPCIYLENSGLGNALNPIYSLADSEIYSLPMLIIIGWRGETGTNDETQYTKQGKILLPSFGASEVHYDILPSHADRAKAMITSVMAKVRDEKCPYFLIVKKGAFEEYQSTYSYENSYELTRGEVISKVISNFNEAKIIATSGEVSKELYEQREKLGHEHSQDFLNIGGLGHSSSIALGVASSSKKEVICLDDDASLLMHMGSMVLNGQVRKDNFKHIILNSGVHNNEISQPTTGHKINIRRIAKSCGYRDAMIIEKPTDLIEGFNFLKKKGPLLLDIRVNTINHESSCQNFCPKELKKLFMDKMKD